MKQWKQRSSVQIKKLLRDCLAEYAKQFDLSEPVWQPRYYDFNIISEEKVREKLEYMHMNPVRAGLVVEPCHWLHSSARFYLENKSVGLPIGAIH